MGRFSVYCGTRYEDEADMDNNCPGFDEQAHDQEEDVLDGEYDF